MVPSFRSEKNTYLCEKMVWHFPLERKLHRRRALDQELAGAHDKRGVCVSDACGELPKCTRITRMRIRPEQNLKRKKSQEGEPIELRYEMLVWASPRAYNLPRPIKFGIEAQEPRTKQTDTPGKKVTYNFPWMANHTACGIFHNRTCLRKMISVYSLTTQQRCWCKTKRE